MGDIASLSGKLLPTDPSVPSEAATMAYVDGKRPLAAAVAAAGAIANNGTWTPAISGSNAPGDIWRATATGAGITLAVPTGSPSDGMTINVELLASVATTLTLHASIALVAGMAATIAVAAGKRWFGALRYVSGVGWFLLASTVQN